MSDGHVSASGHDSAPSPSELAVEAIGSEVDSTQNKLRRGELLDAVRRGRLVVVTGTGVSLHTVGHPDKGTEVASWNGLLRHGRDYCLRCKLMTDSQAKIVDALIDDNAANSLIDAAQKIHDCLDMRQDARLFWLRDTIGQLKVKEPRLIEAIRDLGGFIATINYDSLLENVTGRTALHWRQQSDITRQERHRKRDYILHIHGRWDAPDSVVLDRKSYQEITQNGLMRQVLQDFARYETMLFVGCGETFFDPNFQLLLDWAQESLSGHEHRHFVLCRQSDEPIFYERLRPHGHLEPLVYGRSHEELTPFLEKVASDGAAGVLSTPEIQSGPRPLRPADIWKRQTGQ